MNPTRILLGVLIAVLVLFLMTGCATVSVGSSQEDLKAVLEGKEIVPGGRTVCGMTKPEKLALEDKVVLKVPCIIGTDPREPGNVYVGIYDGGGYITIIMANKDGQTVLWRREGL